MDNLIQIGHNVQIGENCLIAAQTGIAGSAKIENDVTLAGQSGIINHVTVGWGSIVAVKSCVRNVSASFSPPTINTCPVLLINSGSR